MGGPKRPALWSPEASVDIDTIWLYYAHASGPAIADGILREIGKVIGIIEEHPSAGRARDEIRPNLRSFAAGPFVVFYRVHGRRPEIVRVLDGRQDIDEIFSEPA